MNQRLIWNFEFASKGILPTKEIFLEKTKEDLKWEIRFFWPDNEPIVLYPIEQSLLNLTNYRQKYREDYYYLMPGNEYNVKRRRNQLLYKPLLKRSEQAMAYGAKINIDSPGSVKDSTQNPELAQIIKHLPKDGVEVYVIKEAFIYKFPTIPTIKLELARIKIGNNVYLSACIEGKSLDLVKIIAENLLDKQISCDYVTFLKNSVSL